MNRRELLRTGVGAGLLGSLAGCGRAASRETIAFGGAPAGRPIAPSTWQPPPVLATDSADDHRRRLQNIAVCERGIRKCLKNHTLTSYLPGQCVYNLGEYPCRKIWDPDEWDERELDRLREHGIRLLHVHEEWNDALRLFGQDKFTPANPAGFRRFLDMVHARGIKLLVYFSSGFFDRRDPDFRPEWTADKSLDEIYWRYARCSPASAGWRKQLGSNVPMVDPVKARALYEKLSAAIAAGFVASCHDCSDGGLAVALAESAFAGGFGMRLDLMPMGIDSNVAALFSESPSRFVVTISPENVARFEAMLAGCPVTKLGVVTQEPIFNVACGNGKAVNAPLAELKEAWQRPLRW